MDGVGGADTLGILKQHHSSAILSAHNLILSIIAAFDHNLWSEMFQEIQGCILIKDDEIINDIQAL